ncbi:MAG: hypothetical protein PHW03_05210 [Eubacteriales bacterium]|nr:hypothetical protein [Eubacteriales bacterium]
MKKLFSVMFFAMLVILFALPAFAETVSAGNSYTTILPAGKILTVAAPSGTTGSVIRLGRLPGGAKQSTTAVTGSGLIFGPYEQSERFTIIASAGTITVSTAASDLRPKIVTIAMSAVDYVLSVSEALCKYLIVTGSASGQAIIAPLVDESGISREYVVRNTSDDSASVYIKQSGGTGAVIATGKTAEVFYNGSDYVKKTSDATN